MIWLRELAVFRIGVAGGYLVNVFICRIPQGRILVWPLKECPAGPSQSMAAVGFLFRSSRLTGWLEDILFLRRFHG